MNLCICYDIYFFSSCIHMSDFTRWHDASVTLLRVRHSKRDREVTRPNPIGDVRLGEAPNPWGQCQNTFIALSHQAKRVSNFLRPLHSTRSSFSMAETTKPTTQSPPSTNPPTPHTDNSVLTRFKRTISNSNYFNQKSSPKSSQPTSPSAAGSTTTATTPSSQTSGSTGANMTSFEKFMALSKKKKDGDSTFPPPHWFEEVPPAPTYTAPENSAYSPYQKS